MHGRMPRNVDGFDDVHNTAGFLDALVYTWTSSRNAFRIAFRIASMARALQGCAFMHAELVGQTPACVKNPDWYISRPNTSITTDLISLIVSILGFGQSDLSFPSDLLQPNHRMCATGSPTLSATKSYDSSAYASSVTGKLIRHVHACLRYTNAW